MTDGLGPLPLLREDWPLRDLLIFCYNASLGFFERAGLAAARARGGRVTLVSDADMVNADHIATRFAGRSYLDGRALCRDGGRFHPKLLVALGEERATLLIGSGNTSGGGWVSNAELWTKISAATEGAPDSVGRVADFLDDLPALVRFTPGVETVLTEVAAGLRTFPITEEGPLVVSSAFGAIYDQLPPATRTNELLISAPFFDRKAEAVRALVAWSDPKRVELVIQDEAIYDGKRMAAELARSNAQVSHISGKRYHHAKLVEWATPQGRFALTGSPNVSRSALLEPMAEGGNCELAVVSRITESLRPETDEALDPATVASHPWAETTESATTTPVLLLEVILDHDSLHLDLREPLEEPASLQLFDDQGSWVTFAQVPAGTVSPVVAEIVAPGVHLRLLLADGSPSASRSVTDLRRTNFRHVPTKRSVPGKASGIMLDPRFVTQIEQALAAVRAWVGEASTLGGQGGKAGGGTKPPQEGWREYIDGFRSEVGDEFVFFVLPHIMREFGTETTETLPEDADEVEVGDDTSVDEEDLVAAEVALRLSEIAQQLKKHQSRVDRYRKLTERLVKESPKQPEAVRIAAAVLTAGGVALGCWPSGKEVARLLWSSLRPLCVLAADERFRTDAASTAAVGLALMRMQAHNHSEDSSQARLYREATRDLRSLLAYVQREDVAYRCAGLAAEGLWQLLDVDWVMDLTAAAAAPDPIRDAASELVDNHGIAAEVDGRTIDLLHQANDAITATLRVLAMAQEGFPVGARAFDATAQVVALWKAPDLFVCRTEKDWRQTTRYTIGQMRLSDFLHQWKRGDHPSPPGTKRWNGNPPEDVRAAFAEVGITLEPFAASFKEKALLKPKGDGQVAPPKKRAPARTPTVEASKSRMPRGPLFDRVSTSVAPRRTGR